MESNSKNQLKERLHPRNKHRDRYNFEELTNVYPSLKPFVFVNQFGSETIDFFQPEAVKALNAALLKLHYNINEWSVPDGYLCPPIPGRADYIHHIADFLRSKNFGKFPKQLKVLDIGVGANCVYPLIGATEYNWNFVGSEIDENAVNSAKQILANNPQFDDKIEIRHQTFQRTIFRGVIQENELFDLSICNPPFHASANEAQSGTARKLKNLKADNKREIVLNFGGQSNELWCEGGEIAFLKAMIKQSKNYDQNCFWFSSLVSKESNLRAVYSELKHFKAIEVITLPMGQGNKSSRVVAWTFLTPEEQIKWKRERW